MPPLKFPRPEDVAEYIQKIDTKDAFALVSIIANLLIFQADTIRAFADCLIAEARKLELTNKTLTPDELKVAGKKLLDHAETLAPRPEPEINR